MLSCCFWVKASHYHLLPCTADIGHLAVNTLLANPLSVVRTFLLLPNRGLWEHLLCSPPWKSFSSCCCYTTLIDLTPEWSLRAKVKDSENYLKRPTSAEQRRHASSIQIREEAKVLFPAAKGSLSSRCALPATDGPHSHWMGVARRVFLSQQKIFRSELSVIQICTALDR